MRTGKQSAVALKSGDSVANSDPVLRPPTPSARAGRKPAACPSHPQPQSWPGCGAGRPAESAPREAGALSLSFRDVHQLIALFELLDSWDREVIDAKSV
jgi:hypothetical protein